jgi:hypothetical protein
MTLIMSSDPLSMIKARREAIAQEITFLNNRIIRLRAELPELSVAERVLIKLVEMDIKSSEKVSEPPEPEPPAPEPPDPDLEPDPLGEMGPEGAALELPRTRKPDGTPTMPDMILTILADEFRNGKRGMEPKEMTAIIADRWYPGVTTEAVGPIAWRMFKRGQLAKDGPLYLLPQASEGSAYSLLGPPPAHLQDSSVDRMPWEEPDPE